VIQTDQQAALDAAEMRHRMANLFQLLATAGRMRVQRAEGDETRRQLTAMIEATNAVGVLQQRLLGPDGRNFGGLLEDMLPHWRRRCAGRPIAIGLDAEPVFLPEQGLSAAILIAHELVSNAVAHGFPDGRSGRVAVGLRQVGENRAMLTVTDDGVGYDPVATGKTRLGLWLIDGLASQIRGGLITAAAPGGVSVQLTFPTPATTSG
jgi:two-component sensor histidine kinase